MTALYHFQAQNVKQCRDNNALTISWHQPLKKLMLSVSLTESSISRVFF